MIYECSICVLKTNQVDNFCNCEEEKEESIESNYTIDNEVQE